MHWGFGELEIDGQPRTAIELYTESLQLRRQIVDEFGPSPPGPTRCQYLLEKTADMMRALGFGELEIDGQPRTAIELYTESLQLRRQIVDEFGPSPQALRDVSISLEKNSRHDACTGFGELEIDGQPRTAIELYTESLQLRRQIVDQFGPSPQALRDVKCLAGPNSRHDACTGIRRTEIDGQPRTAIELYTESLQLSRQIVDQFGPSPQALRDVMISNHRMALLAFETSSLKWVANICTSVWRYAKSW